MATGFGIQVSVLLTVHPLGFGLGGVFVPGWSWAASGASGSSGPATAAPRATRREICPIQRADEQALKTASTLQPKTLKIWASVGKSGESYVGRVRWSLRRLCCQRARSAGAQEDAQSCRQAEAVFLNSFHRLLTFPEEWLENLQTRCVHRPE